MPLCVEYIHIGILYYIRLVIASPTMPVDSEGQSAAILKKCLDPGGHWRDNSMCPHEIPKKQ